MHLSSTQASIYVAGHRGLVGSAVVRRLREAGYDNLLLRTREALDLRRELLGDRQGDPGVRIGVEPVPVPEHRRSLELLLRGAVHNAVKAP